VRHLLLLIAAIALAGCAAPQQQSRFTSCPVNTSSLQICTMEFVPVCGQNEYGEWRTYSNSCDACASDAKQYANDACEYQEEPLS